MRLVFALTLAALLAPHLAGAADLACPPVLETSGTDRILAPPGWQPRMRPSYHALEFAELFIGDPAKQAQLRGEDRDYPRLVYWDLPAEAEGYTLLCRYDGTSAVLQAQVPREAKRCTVRTQASRDGRQTAAGRRVEAICR